MGKLARVALLAIGLGAACGESGPADLPPVVGAASVTTAEDTPVTVAIDANDPEGAPLTVTVGAPAHGAAVGDGLAFTYTPAADYHGDDAVVVTVDDGAHVVSATITITVTPVNDAPVAAADALAANEDTAATVAAPTLLGNDTDVDGDPLLVTAVAGATGGTVALDGATITFTPAANFTGDATFTYTVSDGTATDTATVTMTVGGDNDVPVAGADAATTAEDTALTVPAATLLANDTDADGQTLTLTAVTHPSGGTVALAGGVVTYAPAPDFHGAATFDYAVSDGAATSTGTITVTIAPVNDAPVAVGGVAATDEDTAVTITLRGSDVDGDPLVFTIATTPATGTLGPITAVDATSATVRYTPGPNSTSNDLFTFRAGDGVALSAAATVTIGLTAVDDGPIAAAQAVMTAEDTALAITLTGADLDLGTDLLTFTIVTAPTAGTLGAIQPIDATHARVTYTPALDSTADDGFTFSVGDGSLTSAAAVAIDVVPVNDAPVATPATATTAEDAPVTIRVSATDVDLASGALTFTVVTGPATGTLSAFTPVTATTADVTYTPALNSTANDGFTFRASDGSAASAPALVQIGLNPGNDAPVANPVATIVTNEDQPVVITLTGLDVDGDDLTFTIDGAGPSAGTLSAPATIDDTTAQVTYTPGLDRNGGDAFAFHVSDGLLASAPVTVTVTVTPVNDAPTATALSTSTAEDVPVMLPLTGGDLDGNPLTFSVVAGPAGTLGAITPTGPTTAQVLYTPAANATGDDSFTFRANDGTVSSPVVTATIAVTPVNDAPVASAAAVTTDEDQAVTVTFAGTDLDGSTTLGVIVTTGPVHGSLGPLTRTSPTSFTATYTPAGDYNGADAIAFQVSDGALGSAAATIAIAVAPIDDAPVAVDGTARLNEDTTVNAMVSGADADGAAVVLTFVVATAPAHGALGAFVRLAPNLGYFPYTPAANYSGADSFTYRASDGALTSAAVATVQITLDPVNDVPVALTATVIATEDQPLDVTLSGTDADGDTLIAAVRSGPTAGVLSAPVRLSPTSFRVTYTPVANSNTAASFTYVMQDAASESAAATITIQITAVGDQPIANAASAVLTEDSVGTDVTLAGTDADPGTTLDFTIVTPPAHGTLGAINRQDETTALVAYVPAANYNGPDGFTYTVTDGALTSAVAAATLTISAVNDAPVATAATILTNEDVPVTLTFAGTDVDAGTTLTVTVTGAPGHGALGTLTRASATSFTAIYTPAGNYGGADTLSFRVSDGTASSADATIGLTITPVNDVPVVFPGSARGNEDDAFNTAVSGSDADGAATELSFTIVTPPAHGTLGPYVRILPNLGTFLYTPAPNYNGTDSYTYRASDGTATSTGVGTVSLIVDPINDAPAAIARTVTTTEDTNVTFQIAGSDVDSATLNLLFDSNPGHGTIIDVARATPTTYDVVYAPQPNYHGPDSFTFHANDGAVNSPSATVTIDVTSVDDAPTASAGNATTAPGAPVTLTLTGADADGDPLTFAIAGGPATGSLGAITVVNATTSSVVFTPAPDSSANASFTFRSHDGTTSSATASFTIVVTAVCADGWVDELEGCDDAGTSPGDGCAANCTVETGWGCSGNPSACAAVCGDGVVAGEEQCDDHNLVDTDGCTSQCVVGQVCSTSNPRIGGFGNRFAVDPATGHCYVGTDVSFETWHFASYTCGTFGGYLAVADNAAEQARIASVQDTTRQPWIGASDVTTEGTLQWVNGAPFTYTHFGVDQPDHSAAAPHCLRLQSGANAGRWAAFNCNDTGNLGRICELDPPAATCGNGAIETGLGEQCDDGNTANGDGCTSTCQHQVFISEYVEGSLDVGLGQIDAIELYNPSSSRVILPSLCLLQAFANGATSGNQSVLGQNDPNERTIEAHGTLVLCTLIGPAGAYQTVCNTGIAPGTLHKSFAFNGLQALTGNDVFALKCGAVSGQLATTGAYVDMIGILGNNPAPGYWGSGAVTTSNHTLRRKCGLQQPRTNPFAPWDPTIEWDSFAVDDISDLGNYVCP